MYRNSTILDVEFPDLRFGSKFADIEALAHGNPDTMRPSLTPTARDRLDAMAPPGTQTALIIGGNGFVGAHLAARLAREPQIREVWTTIRATEKQTPRQRLEQTLSRYQVPDSDLGKITILDADPTRKNFGLPRERYQELAQHIDQVFNCASSSDYSASYLDMRENWFRSLLRILRFTTEAKRKHLTYMGSIGAYLYQTSTDFHRPDSWWYSGYNQMKWVNGTLLRWLGQDEALSVTLCEAPYILGATDVGLDPAQHYSWWRIIEIARSIRAIWDGPGMCYVPVDVLVDVMTRNALSDKPLTRLLPRNPVPYDNRLLAELLALRLVSWPEFLQLAIEQVSSHRVNTVLSSDFDRLVRIVNAEPAVLPNDHDASWCDNRRIFELYLKNIEWRDVRRTPWRTPVRPETGESASGL